MKIFSPFHQDNSDATTRQVVQGCTAFGLDLYHQLAGQEGNLFFSPLSISLALAMTYAGAHGETESQMAKALHFELKPKLLHPAFAGVLTRLKKVHAGGEVSLHLANAIWPQQGSPFLPEFVHTLQEHYGAEVTPLDFGHSEAARQTINAWVEAITQQTIKDMIPPGLLDPLTRMVLTNAIYFKGNWEKPFDPAVTLPAPFWVHAQEPVEVALMQQSGEFGYARLDGLQILELPYAGKQLSMLLLLPEARDGLPALERALTPANLRRWLALLHPQEVVAFLPRFRTHSAFILNDPLSGLGMRDAFDSRRANFAGMDGNPNYLYLVAALHNASIDVDEKGSEAAAATAVVVAAREMPAPKPVFRADHPLIFLIRAQTNGEILFLGRLARP